MRPSPLYLALLLSVASLSSACLSFHSGPMPGEPLDATYANVDGIRMRYLDLGQGEPVVLIHGFASALETWATVWPSLLADYRIIAMDLKGFGWTERPEGDYSPQAQAQLVLGLMDHLGVERAAVVAHSWGSSVALQMALAAPERVTRLALYDAWVYFEQLPTFFVMARASGIGEILTWLFYKERPADKMTAAFYDPRWVNEAFAEEVAHALDRPGTEAAALAAIRDQRFEDLQDAYRTITQPVLLLWGREDKVTRLHFGERLVNHLPNAKLIVYGQCGHFPMIEARGPSTRDLLDFLAAGHIAPAATTAPVTTIIVPAPQPAPVPGATTESHGESPSHPTSTP